MILEKRRYKEVVNVVLSFYSSDSSLLKPVGSGLVSPFHERYERISHEKFER
jgi:hypothetical protein